MMRHCHGALSIIASIVLAPRVMAVVVAEDIKIQIEESPKESSIFVQTNDPSLALNRFTFEGNVLPVPGSGRYRVENWIVVYCLDWFEPCRDLAPMWSTLSSEWQGKLNDGLLTQQVRFARVDCAVDKVLCNERDVNGYPTIQRFHKGKVVSSIHGFRSQTDMKTRITKWLTTNLAPADLAPEDGLMARLKKRFTSHLKFGNAAKGGLTVLLALGATALTILLAGSPEMREKTAPPTFSDIDLIAESELVQSPPAAPLSAVTTRSTSSHAPPEHRAVPVCLSMEL